MLVEDWVSYVLGALVIAAIFALARLGLGAQSPRVRQQRRFVCPHMLVPVDCDIVQDVRTGQYKEVRRCSLFSHPEEVACDRGCLKRLNLGFRLEGWEPAR